MSQTLTCERQPNEALSLHGLLRCRQASHMKLGALYAVGRVTALLGKECQRESERLGYGCEDVKSWMERWQWASAVRISTFMPQTFTCERRAKEAHSLHAFLRCGQAWDHSQSTGAWNFYFSVATETHMIICCSLSMVCRRIGSSAPVCCDR
jgi:hypothetical protein